MREAAAAADAELQADAQEFEDHIPRSPRASGVVVDMDISSPGAPL